MQWLPDIWLDEYTPDLADNVDQFIDKKPDGSFQLRRLPGDRDCEEDDLPGADAFWIIPLEVGQLVTFCWTESYGDFTVHKNEDGATVTDFVVPPAANCFRIDHDNETIQSTLHELMGLVDPGEWQVDAYTWSNSVGFAFLVTPDGKGHFVEVGAIQ